VIHLAVEKLGMSPRQFLREHTTSDVFELIAYFNLQTELAEQRRVDTKLHNALGKPNAH